MQSGCGAKVTGGWGARSHGENKLKGAYTRAVNTGCYEDAVVQATSRTIMKAD